MPTPVAIPMPHATYPTWSMVTDKRSHSGYNNTMKILITFFFILLYLNYIFSNDSDIFLLRGDVSDNKNKNTIPFIMIVVGRSGSTFFGLEKRRKTRKI